MTGLVKKAAKDTNDKTPGVIDDNVTGGGMQNLAVDAINKVEGKNKLDKTMTGLVKKAISDTKDQKPGVIDDNKHGGGFQIITEEAIKKVEGKKQNQPNYLKPTISSEKKKSQH